VVIVLIHGNIWEQCVKSLVDLIHGKMVKWKSIWTICCKYEKFSPLETIHKRPATHTLISNFSKSCFCVCCYMVIAIKFVVVIYYDFYYLFVAVKNLGICMSFFLKSFDLECENDKSCLSMLWLKSNILWRVHVLQLTVSKNICHGKRICLETLLFIVIIIMDEF
jgi:hypothetical protein